MVTKTVPSSNLYQSLKIENRDSSSIWNDLLAHSESGSVILKFPCRWIGHLLLHETKKKRNKQPCTKHVEITWLNWNFFNQRIERLEEIKFQLRLPFVDENLLITYALKRNELLVSLFSRLYVIYEGFCSCGFTSRIYCFV